MKDEILKNYKGQESKELIGEISNFWEKLSESEKKKYYGLEATDRQMYKISMFYYKNRNTLRPDEYFE